MAGKAFSRSDMLELTSAFLLHALAVKNTTAAKNKRQGVFRKDFIGSQRAYPTAHNLPEFSEEQDGGPIDFDPNDRDPLFDEAARIIVVHQQGSTSLLQRKLKLGYNRAGRIIDQLEAAGIVGSFEGSKARDVLITSEMALEQFLKDLNQKGLK